MSVPNIFASGFADTVFPGVNGVPNAQIDQFVDLLDAVTTTSLRDDQIVYAQFYNKMRNALIAVQRYIDIDTLSSSCPVSSDIWDGDGTVTNLSLPLTHEIPMNKLIGWVTSTHVAGVTGQVMPFEIIVVPNSNHGYKNSPNKAWFIVESPEMWTLLQSTHLASVALKPYNLQDFDTDVLSTSGDYSNSYVNSLSVTWHEVIGYNAVIFRGFITDHENETARLTHWSGLGDGLNLCLAVVSL